MHGSWGLTEHGKKNMMIYPKLRGKCNFNWRYRTAGNEAAVD